MIDQTLTIILSRLLLPGAPSPLEFSGLIDDTVFGVMNFQRPALASRLGYMANHPDVDGSELTSVSWDKSLLNFDWICDTATTEAQLHTAHAEVVDALSQFQFTVTTEESDADPEVWYADRGSITPTSRSYADRANARAVFQIAIPVQPIPGAP